MLLSNKGSDSSDFDPVRGNPGMSWMEDWLKIFGAKLERKSDQHVCVCTLMSSTDQGQLKLK